MIVKLTLFENPKSDYFIKSGNLGGFQIFFKDEFFAPFGYSGEVNDGFYLKEKIKRIREKKVVKYECKDPGETYKEKKQERLKSETLK